MNKDLIYLVVDDDPMAREIVTQFLTASECTKIIQVNNGREALDFMRSSRVDFIISDWDMPVLNGLELLKAVRTDEKLAKLPFLMITSPISQEKMKVADAGSSGVDGYLIKPFRRRGLIQKISDILFQKTWESTRGILVVDDDEQVRNFIVDAVTGFGYSPVFSAPDGEKGLATLEAHQSEIALVLSDWDMPKLSGIDLLRKIRTSRALTHTPFVMITAQTPEEPEKVKKAIESEVDHYLMKPFRLEDLKQKVSQVLASAKAELMRKRALSSGQMALQDRDTVEAEKFFSWVMEQDPNNVEAILGLASAELKAEPNKGVQAATRLIERAIRLNPRMDLPYIKMAEVYESILALEKAISYLRDASRLVLPSSALHCYLARLLIRRGRPEEGNLELKKALEIDPENRDAIELYDFKSVPPPGDGKGENQG